MSGPARRSGDPAGGEAAERGLLARLPLAQGRPLIAVIGAIDLVLIGLLLRLAVDDYLPAAFPFVTFFPAIVLSAFLFGLRAGLIAAVLGYLISRIYFIETPDGTWFSTGMALAMMLYALVAGSILAAIHLMQRAYRRLEREQAACRELAENRQLLMREMHHRVGNNLQMVAALLALQKRQVSEPQAVRALDDASRRVGLIGRVQRQLHSAEDGDLALGPFVDRLCRDIVEAAGRDDIAVSLDEDRRCVLPAEQVMPIALVVAEAVSNAIEHGFGEGRGGAIAVSITQEEGDLVVRIANNGRGLSPDFAMGDRTSVGLTIATLLARRLGGQFRLDPQPGEAGATALLRVPLTKS